MNATIFQPIVSIYADGTVDTDWSGSYIWTVDSDGIEVDDEVTEERATNWLDDRLAAIRELIAAGQSVPAELVAPFFAVEKPEQPLPAPTLDEWQNTAIYLPENEATS